MPKALWGYGLLGLASLIACGDDAGSGGTGGKATSTTATSDAASTSTGTTSTGSGGSGGSSDGTLVTTDKGPVQGAVLGASRVFLGIPFAAPPIGPLRWKPPQAHDPWTTPVDATTRKPACAQLGSLNTTFDAASSEDCLTLNVWTPKTPAASPLPVMLWIYGGSFAIGDAADPAYDGQKLSEASGAVVVTINYRLGPLGFMALAELEAEDPAHPASGNYGLEDQRAALSWAHDNIAAFGGDPANVTVFGESAGGISTCLHLVSPKSAGLFQRAMIESGACSSIASTQAAAQTRGSGMVTKLGCTGAGVLDCMRGKTAEEVLEAEPVTPFQLAQAWSPNIDGFDIPDAPKTLLDAGSVAHVPVLIGTNDNEGSLFFAFGSTVTDDATYLAFVEGFYPGHGAAIVAHYPSATYGSAKDAATVALGDAGFVCPGRTTARALANAGNPTFVYHFEYAPQALLPGLGAFHSSEIPYVFGNPGPLTPMSPTAAEAPLVTSMQGYWSRMAKAGDPNGGGAFAWPAFTTATDENVVLDLTVSQETNRKKADCDFWDSIQ